MERRPLFTPKLIKLMLVVLIIIAFGLRAFMISSNPPALNWDEVSHGYNAYSILRTGRDELGRQMPLIFRAYGDYKLPGYIYLTSVSVAVFGLNAFSIRLVSVLAGTSLVWVTYLLTSELFKKKEPCLFAAFLVAVEPWSLFLSRGAFEANLGAVFFVWGLYFLLKGVREKSDLFFWGMTFMGLSVWAYNSYRVFLPFFLVGFGYLYREELTNFAQKRREIFAISVLVGLILFGGMAWQLKSSEGQARFGWVSIIDSGAIAEINNSRNTSGLPSLTNRLVYNKVTYFIPRFAKNYFLHFSPSFLFFDGGDNYQFSVPDFGLIYPFNALFLLWGLVYLIKVRTKGSKLIFTWIILAPVASSMTREAPHTLRYITVLPVPMILVALGLFSIVEHKKRKAVIYGLYVLIILFFLANYLAVYFGDYREKYSESWQYGYKEAIDYVDDNYDKYDKVIMTKRYGEPHEFVLFYQKWDPESYRKDTNLVRFFQSNWFWVDSFDKYFFVNDWQILTGAQERMFRLESGIQVDCNNKKCLLIASPDYEIVNWTKIKEIDFLNEKKAFLIYANY